MLEGLDDDELENYMEENPQIVPLLEIDVMETTETYTTPATITDAFPITGMTCKAS